MAKGLPRIQLRGPHELELQDGSVYVVQPGPYRKGIAVFAVLPRRSGRAPRAAKGEPGKRGRKPRPSTVALREKLEADKKANRLREPPVYVKWLIDKDEEIGLPMARTVVYRELKKYR